MFKRIFAAPIKWSLRLWYHLVATYYRFKNRHKPKLLVYTDSRGHEITKLRNRYNPFASYIGHLMRNYCVYYYLCPERSTTIPDFLEVYRKSKTTYDHIILHTGVVDFAPRPISMIEDIYNLKQAKFDAVIPTDRWREHIESKQVGWFEGVETMSIYSQDIAAEFILPQLQNIPNLIWISSNHFVPGWEGNYPRKRPDNINVIAKYTEKFVAGLPGCIDLRNWSDDEIKLYTCDNVHFTEAGFNYLRDQIVAILSP